MGEKVIDWITMHTVTGFIDLMNGDSSYTSYNAKIQESTHIFYAIISHLIPMLTTKDWLSITNCMMSSS